VFTGVDGCLLEGRKLRLKESTLCIELLAPVDGVAAGIIVLVCVLVAWQHGSRRPTTELIGAFGHAFAAMARAYRVVLWLAVANWTSSGGTSTRVLQIDDERVDVEYTP